MRIVGRRVVVLGVVVRAARVRRGRRTGRTTRRSRSRCSRSRARGRPTSCGSRPTAGASRSSEPWAGYRWDELVPDRGLPYPAVRHHADAGLDNQLAFLDAALDYVAANTPARPRDAVPRGDGDGMAQRRSARRSRSSAASVREAPMTASRASRTARWRGFDELLGRPVSMRSLALLRVLVGPVVLLHLRPFLVRRAGTGGSTATRSTSRTPPGTRSCRAAVYVALLWLAAVAAVAMTSGCSRGSRRRRRSRSSPTTCSSRRRTSTTTGRTS